MSVEIAKLQLATLFGIIIVLVITGMIAGNQVFYSKEPFSPLGFTSNTPAFRVPTVNAHIESCGPGCWDMKHGIRDVKEPFGNYKPVNGSNSTSRVPHYAKQLPMGHLSTMGSPLLGQASCTSGVNGVQRLAKRNPYGELVKDYGKQKDYNQFTQSYAACEFGAANIFDEDQLQY